MPDSRRLAAALVLLLTAVALWIRAVDLGRLPLWVDEAFSLVHVTRRPFSEWRLDIHPPLYYALLWGWTRLSTSDSWLRLLSALVGAATVPAVYALGHRLVGRACGLWAGAFLAVMWMHVWYSREARMYPVLVLAFTLALWGLVAGARDGLARGWVVYALAGAAVAWSHAVGIYYAAILAGLALVIRREDGQPRTVRPWLVANVAMGLLFAPRVPAAIERTRETARAFWILAGSAEPPIFTTLHHFTVAPIPSPATLVRPRLGLELGPLFGVWLWLVPLLAVLALALTLGLHRRRSAVQILALSYLAPIGLFTALSLVVRPILIPRILLPVVVPLALLLAVGVESLPRRWMRGVAGATIALVLLLGAMAGVRNDAGVWEDWREASRHVQTTAAPGDVVLIIPYRLAPNRVVRGLEAGGRSAVEEALRRYDDTGRLGALRIVSIRDALAGCPHGVGPCLDLLVRASPAARHVWLVRRAPVLPPEMQPWVDLRLDPGPITRPHGIILEQRPLRP